MDKNLTVALVCDAIYPHSRGGREFRYQALIPRLAERTEMHVYTMHWWSGPKVYTDGRITYHAISSLLPMYTHGRRSTLQALRFGAACLRILLSRFDVLDADHIPYFQIFALRLVATIKRKPLVVTWHEVWSRSYWCSYLGWLGWLAWLLESIAMRLPDHIIAASSQTAERLREVIGERASITIVPNGTDIGAIARVRADPQGTDIVAVGRLIDHKRIDGLLEVIASLHSRGIYVTCRIIGDGPERQTLQHKAHVLGIDSSVQFRPDVEDQADLFSLIKASRLFVSLSMREGFGMAVLEAIACGVPVLTTSAPDNLARYLVERYSRGFVCGAGIDEITNAVQQILAEPDQNNPEESLMDPWVSEYDWETMTDRVMGIYSTHREMLRPTHVPIPVLDW